MITKDSNVMVVAVAGNIVAGLAAGLRKGFQSYAPSVSQGGGVWEGGVWEGGLGGWVGG